MKASSTRGILAFLIAAPVVVICCGRHAEVLASLVGGKVGTATGFGVFATLLIAVTLFVVALAVRTSFEAAVRMTPKNH